MPDVITRGQQAVADLLLRITDSKLSLLVAIEAGKVTWYYPAGADHAHTLIREGRKTRVVTGEVNWLRSHGLANLANQTGPRSQQRTVILTAKGQELLSALRTTTTTTP